MENEPQQGIPLLTLAEMERQAIIHAAKVSRGQLNEMAQLLDIGRTTLWRKIKQYQIDIRQFKLRA